MTKTTYKVGDKVRVLNAKAIMACEAKDGDILAVVDVDYSNEPVLLDVDGERLCMLGSELKYIEKVAEQVAKFKVGDKVKVVAASRGWGGVSKGDEGVITRINNNGSYEAKIPSFGEKITWSGAEECFELASPKPTKNQRITTLEQTVADLQAEVEALKAAQKLPTMTVKVDVDVATIAESLAKAIDKHTPKSPNEQRKAIIAEAKAFVKNTEQRAGAQFYKAQGDSTKRMLSFKYEVNTKKRTVVALGFGSRSNTLRGKGIAKCAPGDVFNADIGKAIALGRALGLDVSKFEKAVQPSEVVAGMKINDESEFQTVRELIDLPYDTLFSGEKVSGQAFNTKESPGWLAQSQITIADDTEAQY